MIKITDIEALLNLPYDTCILIKNVPTEDIQELARYYGANVRNDSFFDSTFFKRNGVEISLNSKAKDMVEFPKVDLEFLNIKK